MNITTFKTLFTKDKTGTVRIWTIEVRDSNYTVAHGILGGKVVLKTTTCKPKNIGRKNETTAEQQAILEAKALHKKQMDKGYSTDVNCVTPVKNPMLAMDFYKMPHGISWGIDRYYTQPKLDGVRVLVSYNYGTNTVKFKSRGGKKFRVPAHLQQQLAKFFVANKHKRKLVLDGELYIHGTKLQDIVSCVKKANENTPNLELHIFDTAIEDMIFTERLVVLDRFEKQIEGFRLTHVKMVPFEVVNNQAELDKQHDYWVDLGYEGIMIRAGQGLYLFNQRSRQLIKYKANKNMNDTEFRIVGHTKGKEGGVIWIIQVTDDVTCKVQMSATLEEKRRLYSVAESYHGKWLKVQYQALTKSNNLQFPVGLAIRDDDMTEI